MEMLKKIVRSKPDLIAEYPMLSEIFNSDGTIKDINDVLVNKKYNKMISNYILYEIYLKNINQLDMSNKNLKQINNIWDNLSMVFEELTTMIINFMNSHNLLYKKNAKNSLIEITN